MKLSELVSKLAKAEGLKKEVSVGNIRELLKVLAVLIANDLEVQDCFVRYVNKKKVKK